MLRHFRHRLRLPSFLIAGLALVSQLALGAAVLPDAPSAAKLAALEAVSVICIGKSAPNHGAPPHHHHRGIDPALCPLSVALALPGVVLLPAPALPLPSTSVRLSRTRDRPPGRGPPAASARVGAPRAPPLTA